MFMCFPGSGQLKSFETKLPLLSVGTVNVKQFCTFSSLPFLLVYPGPCWIKGLGLLSQNVIFSYLQIKDFHKQLRDLEHKALDFSGTSAPKRCMKAT